MGDTNLVRFDNIDVPGEFLEALKGVGADLGFRSWEKLYRKALTLDDKLDLLTEVDVAYRLKKQGATIEFHPSIPDQTREPDLDVKWYSERLFYAEVKRLRHSAPERIHQELKMKVVNEIKKIAHPFGFLICFRRRLTSADDSMLLSAIVEFCKHCVVEVFQDPAFCPGNARDYTFDHIEHNLGEITIINSANETVHPVCLEVGDFYNIYSYSGDEEAKIRNEIFDGNKPKYKQLPLSDSGIIILKADSDSHEAEDLEEAFTNALSNSDLRCYPNLSAAVLISNWVTHTGESRSKVVYNKYAQHPLSDRAREIIEIGLLKNSLQQWR